MTTSILFFFIRCFHTAGELLRDTAGALDNGLEIEVGLVDLQAEVCGMFSEV